MSKAKISIVGLLVLPVIILAGLQRQHPPLEFCARCIMSKSSTQWSLFGIPLFETSEIAETDAGKLLARAATVRAHSHEWSAPREVGESELETSDAPRVRSIGLLNTPRCLNFLRNVLEYTDQSTIRSWYEVVQQPLYASSLDGGLYFCRYPEDGFSDQTAFFGWWNQNSHRLFHRLNQVTVSD